MTEQEKIRINELVFKSLEGTISQDECRELESLIAVAPAARVAYYTKCVDICLGLSKIQQIISDPLHMTNYLQKMAEYEKTAQIIPCQKDVIKEEYPVIEKIDVCASRKSRMLSFYTAVAATAALVMMLLYVNFNPHPISQDVATLINSIEAKWTDPAKAIKVGMRLLTNQGPTALKEGIIEIGYDDGVHVVIEAPAEYELLTPTEIAVNYGRLYAKVSDAGKGFTVKTRNSRIIDLGTEFGVLADVQGDTQLHVFKGKTTLIAGSQRSQKSIINVPAGKAMEVDDFGTRDIELQKTAFTRAIDPQTGFIWKGEDCIDLANIIGGGNGLNNRYPGREISFITSQDLFGHPLLGPRDFLPISTNPFINGIFIPNGAQGPVSVVRDGSITWNAPSTEVRQKIGYIRFDISSIKGNRSNAAVCFNVSSWEGKKLNIQVYGLTDESKDLWDESQICYNNAPGFSASPLGQYTLNETEVESLGTLSLNGLGLKTSSPTSLNMDSFINSDTNGLLTLILICKSSDPGDDWKMTTKEGNLQQAPKLIFPYAAAGQTVLEVMTAQGRGADTYLSNDNQYTSTGPDTGHGTESVIKIRDYKQDFVYISNTTTIRFEENGITKTQTLSPNRSAYDISNSPVIGMRAIAGITFDLQKIRNYYPGRLSPKSFTASCEMMETASRSPRSSFYVLVDGQERFTKVDMAPDDNLCAIEVKLTGQDRFLTLVATDGTNRKSPRDWCFFVRPQLNIDD